MRSLTFVLALSLVALNMSGQSCCIDPTYTSDLVIAPNDACSPIVINFDNGGYRLTGADSPVLFDIAATGHPVWIGWTAAGADEAFLCLDRNHNGQIDSGAELFCSATPLKDGTRASDGFTALAEFDDNHDGVIDEKDGMWKQILLWRDLNHNGISQPNELTLATDSSLTAIHLDDHWTGRRDVSGNYFRYQAAVAIQATTSRTAPRPVYDIFFVHVTLRAQSSQQVKQGADTAVELREAIRRLAVEPPDVAREYEHLASEPFESRRHLFAALPSSMKSALWAHHLVRAVTTHPEFTAEQQSVIYDGIRLLSPALYETGPATGRKDLDDFTLRAQRLFSPDVALSLFVEIGSAIPIGAAREAGVELNRESTSRSPTEGDQRALPKRDENARRPIGPMAMDCSLQR